MNMIERNCKACSCKILVNQKALVWNAKSHYCHQCVHDVLSKDDSEQWKQVANQINNQDAEFDLETEEEEQLVNPFNFSDIDEDNIDDILEKLEKAYGIEETNKCTCGAHAINSNFHSDWCDLDEELI